MVSAGHVGMQRTPPHTHGSLGGTEWAAACPPWTWPHPETRVRARAGSLPPRPCVSRPERALRGTAGTRPGEAGTAQSQGQALEPPRGPERPTPPCGPEGGSTHQSSSTTRTRTKKVFLLTRFLNVSAKGENFSYVERVLKKQPFPHGWGQEDVSGRRQGAWARHCPPGTGVGTAEAWAGQQGCNVALS